MNRNPENPELPFVSVILPVLNEERYLETTLQNLTQADYPRDRFEIIIVDNGSTDNSFKIAKQYADKCYVKKNANVGAVRNYGVQHAKGQVIAFLDADCLAPRNWITTGVTRISTDETLVLGGIYNLREDPLWIEKYWLLDSHGYEVSLRDLVGGCIFISKNCFEEAGGFNENISSGEDSALSSRLKSQGKNVVIDPQLGVVHLGNPQTVFDFIRRQAWHAENYILNLGESIRDKVFLLVSLYFAGFCGLLLLGFGIRIPLALIAIAILAPPAALSLKRMLRSKFYPVSLASLLSIYVIDHLYLVGRSIGLIKGIVKSATRHSVGITGRTN